MREWCARRRMRAGAATRASTANANANAKRAKVSTSTSETMATTVDDAVAPCAHATCDRPGYSSCGDITAAIACAHANCCERIYREREASSRGGGGGGCRKTNASTARWCCAATIEGWNRKAAAQHSIEIFEWLKSRDAYLELVLMSEAIRLLNVVCVKWLFRDRGAEFWKTHPKYEMRPPMLMENVCSSWYGPDETKMLELLHFFKEQGAEVNASLLDVAFSGCRYPTRVIDFCHESGLVTDIESYRLEHAVREGTLDVVKHLREHCAVRFDQVHLVAGVSALKYETVKYLIEDAGVEANMDALLDELEETMMRDDTLDWKDEDPHEVQELYNQLRKLFRARLGITPERDRLRLRTILACIDAQKDSMQIAEYLDICQFLKRLHKEAGK